MTDKTLCRFFAVGTCNRGASCQYSHDLNSHPNNVCSFFLRGVCQFGDRCRYEHTNPTAVVVPSLPSTQLWASAARPPPAPYAAAAGGPSVPSVAASGPVGRNVASHNSNCDVDENDRIMDEMEEWLASQEETEWWISQEVNENSAARPIRRVASESTYVSSTSGTLQEQTLCGIFTATGRCPKGSTCTKLHGDGCPFCERRCLHPFRKEESAAHLKSCERNQKMLEVVRSSQEVECCVCLEKVLSKPAAAERKFGIMSHCDHPFCIGCIRGWRQQGGRDARMDVDTVVRACPVCRIQSHFITPSALWFFTPGEKGEIIEGYKKKLKSIDCKYFAFGEGRCQFGTSCFYRHAYRDGSMEHVKLRHLGGAEGSVIAREVKLSDFLSRLTISGQPSGGGGVGGRVDASHSLSAS